MGDWLQQSAKWFVMGVFATLVLMLIISFLPPSIIPKPSWSWEMQESVLHKNSDFLLRPSESLEYSTESSSGSRRVVIAALPSRDCPGVVLADITSAQVQYGNLASAQAAQPGVFLICIGKDGVERDNQNHPLGSNLSFTNATWPYFAPWMLALTPNFSWSANISLRAMPVNLTSTQTLEWRVLNTTTYGGRPVYEVEVKETRGNSSAISSPSAMPTLSSSGGASALLYIDTQYRVLLYTHSSTGTIRLLRAPFEFNATTDAPKPS